MTDSPATSPATVLNLWHWLAGLILFPQVELIELIALRAGAWWCLLLIPGFSLFRANPAFISFAHHGSNTSYLSFLLSAIILLLLAICSGRNFLRGFALFCLGTGWGFGGCLILSTSHFAGRVPVNPELIMYFGLALDCYVAGIHLFRRALLEYLDTRKAKIISRAMTRN